MKEIIIGSLRLICGDCMDVMRSLGDKSVGLAVVDPDYGLRNRLQGGTWAERWGKSAMRYGGMPDREYFKALERVSRERVVWGGNYFTHLLPPTRCFLIWNKKDKNRTMADCEMAWTSFDRNARVFTSARNPGGISGKGRIHLCQKPVQLYMWIYDNFASPGFDILDTHMGSGSSAIAVYEHNRQLIERGLSPLTYTGVEIDPDCFDKAVGRISQHINTHPYTA